MKIVIIGAVAAGTSVAAKARRNSEEAQIVVYEKDTDISYSVCGLPYYIAGSEIKREKLVPRNPEWFLKRHNIQIHTAHEVLKIDPSSKTLTVKNLSDQTVFEDSYDKLVLTTGASPIVPDIKNIHSPHVFFLRNVKDADALKSFILTNKPKNALIIGSGFIALEMLESLSNIGINTTVIERENRLMPRLDPDISILLENELEKRGIRFVLSQSVNEIHQKLVSTDKGSVYEADFILVAAGVRPNTTLLKEIGIKTGKSGGILVNEKMETSLKDIYAAGDCCEHLSLLTGEMIYRPMGSTANKMGRILGDGLTGGDLRFQGILGTGICRIFDKTIASTGMTEKEALSKGYDIEVIHNIKENQSSYLPESSEMLIKAVADKKTETLLGVQIFGGKGVDKRIDVFAAAISFKAKTKNLFHLDLAYSPQFATTKDPIHYTGMILTNSFQRERKIITPRELKENRKNWTVIDVRSLEDYEKGHIPDALHIPFQELKEKSKDFRKSKPIVVHCNKGTTGNAAQNLLINLGFQKVYNLSGGYQNWKNQENL
ncbi:MAG TPA: dehydrogenase [Spirochaetia bacterium]|nr:MAG: dehydrogenase [Spirochaetes bacterium GWB1_36_13]HCL55815.1 dehydrogenase [Spirochaetia bacterium]